MWKLSAVDIKVIDYAEQFMQAEVYGRDKKLIYNITIIYAFNQLEKRRQLWKTIENLGEQDEYPLDCDGGILITW